MFTLVKESNGWWIIRDEDGLKISQGNNKHPFSHENVAKARLEYMIARKNRIDISNANFAREIIKKYPNVAFSRRKRASIISLTTLFEFDIFFLSDGSLARCKLRTFAR